MLARPQHNETLEEPFETFDRTRGYNPAFLQRVWEKRRAKIAQIEREAKSHETSNERPGALTRRQQELRIIAEDERKRILAAKAEKERRRQMAIARLREAKEKAASDEGARLLSKDIIKAVAARHNVTYDDIVGPRRHKWLTSIRFEAIREVADLRPDLGLPQIGRVFNRDHTSILHALKKTARNGELRPTREIYRKHD